MEHHSLLIALPALAVIALVGRVALALGPPGWPGGHAPRELAVTWAASHVLGIAVLAFEIRALALLGWSPTPVRVLLPWLVLGGLRLATLPGAFVPCIEPRREASGRASRIVMVLGAALLAVALARSGWSAFASQPARRLAAAVGAGPAAAAFLVPVSFAAASLAVVAGLERTRRAPIVRASALVALGLAWILAGRRASLGSVTIPFAQLPGLPPALFATGAALGLAWFRRADRRAAVVAGLAFAGAALVEPAGWPWGLAGATVLVAASPRTGRRWLLGRIALPLLIAVGLGYLLQEREVAGILGHLLSMTLGEPENLVGVASVSLIAMGAVGIRLRRDRAAPRIVAGEPDPLDRSLVAAALFLCGAALAWWWNVRLPGGGPGFAELFPVAVLYSGLLLGRPERVARPL